MTNSCHKCGSTYIVSGKRGEKGDRGKRGKRGFTGSTGYTGPTGNTNNEFDTILINNIELLNSSLTGISINDSILLSTAGNTASPLNYYSTTQELITFDYDTQEDQQLVSLSRIGNMVTITIPQLSYNDPGNDKITSDGPITANSTFLPTGYIISSTFYLADGSMTGPARCFIDSTGSLSISTATEGNISVSNQLIVDPFSFTFVRY